MPRGCCIDQCMVVPQETEEEDVITEENETVATTSDDDPPVCPLLSVIDDTPSALEVLTIDEPPVLDNAMVYALREDDQLVTAILLGYAFISCMLIQTQRTTLCCTSRKHPCQCLHCIDRHVVSTTVTGEWFTGRPVGFGLPPFDKVTATESVLWSIQQHVNAKAQHLATALVSDNPHKNCECC